VTSVSAPNATIYLHNFILFKVLFKWRRRISTVYECVEEQITKEFLELKCLVYMVNPDDERDLENTKKKDMGEWEQPYLLPCVPLPLPLY
jgi:hypothetical protein